MSGRDYLSAIKKELEAGRHQNRMGENLLTAFGYVRRRESAIAEINKDMRELGLLTYPPIDAQMPLRTPRIRFILAAQSEAAAEDAAQVTHEVSKEEVTKEEVAEEDAATIELLKEQLTTEQPTLIEFRVRNLPSAEKTVLRVAPDSTVKNAYTLMRKNKFSQLVVASKDNPRYSDVKGLISDRSITDAYMRGGTSMYVRDCMESKPPQVPIGGDIEAVINQLEKNDVVLVTAEGDLVVGIITAWDLQTRFAELAVPFSLIAEIESRLRIVASRIGIQTIVSFLGLTDLNAYQSISDLTLGELARVLQNPDFWAELKIDNYERQPFIDAVEEARELRNLLMHFRDEGSLDVSNLRNVCDLLRGMPI